MSGSKTSIVDAVLRDQFPSGDPASNSGGRRDNWPCPGFGTPRHRNRLWLRSDRVLHTTPLQKTVLVSEQKYIRVVLPVQTEHI